MNELYAAKDRIFSGAGQIVARVTPNVRTTTGNLAELVAFTRALQWARSFALVMGKPICMRYTAEYAARIATGAWKARKHKAMAEEARRAWAALKRSNGGRVWMRHAPGTTAEATTARALAARGQSGERVYAEDVT